MTVRVSYVSCLADGAVTKSRPVAKYWVHIPAPTQTGCEGSVGRYKVTRVLSIQNIKLWTWKT